MRHVGKDWEGSSRSEGRPHAVPREGRQVHYAVSGTKGYLWMEAEVAENMDDLQIDMSYFEKLKDDAVKTIEQFGPFDQFVVPRR
jgi:hypothetical protein